MCDHDYDGLLPKSGKRHLGKTRWTREEVNNHVIKTWDKPRVCQFMKKMLQLNYRCSNSLAWAYAPCWTRSTPHACAIQSSSKLFVVLWISRPQCMFHLCFSLPFLLLPFCTTSYSFFITCEDITSSVRPSLASPGRLDASSRHWLHIRPHCCCDVCLPQ